MTIQATASSGGLTLALSGSALVEAAEAAAAELLAVLGRSKGSVTFDLSGLSRVDVTFFQLLVACDLLITKRGGTMRVLELPPGHIVSIRGELFGFRLVHHFPLVAVEA